MNYIPVSKGLLPRVALNGYTDSGAAAKEAFHKAGTTFLRKLAKELNLQRGEFGIRSNLSGVAGSGEVTLHSDDIYVQLHESCVRRDGVSVLYRSCKSRMDCAGHQNHHVAMQDLADERRQARFVRELMNLIMTERIRKDSLVQPA